MVLMTMIARISDGLPLAASIQDDETVCNVYPKLICLNNYYFQIIINRLVAI